MIVTISLQKLIPLSLFLNFISISVSAAAFSSNSSSSSVPAPRPCIQSCGEGKSAQHVNYPFGFSNTCEIQLNCTPETNQIHLHGFQIQNLTSDDIQLHFPANCTRSIHSIRSLFNDRYSPSWQNGLLLRNCTSSQQSNGCAIPPSLMQSRFERLDCDGSGSVSNKNTSCYAAEERGSGTLYYADILRVGCKSLFSSIFASSTSETDSESNVSLEFQTMQLAWWLPGQCNCSEDAECTPVWMRNASAGFRCRCREGFSGDGFVHGAGCWKVPKERSYIPVLIGGLIVGASVMAILATLCYYIRRHSISSKRRRRAKRLLTEAAGNSSVILYAYKDIERATYGFSEKQRLGTGAYGTVYAGKFHDEDQWVAIKRIKHRDAESTVQVMNEIKLLSSVSHPNLVRLLGCCIENGEQILVYDYMPNGTLSQHLQRERGKALPWTIRLTIASETAQAIAYLHTAMNPPIYHRDVKSSNILLDYSYKSKVADFGLSRLGITESTSHISTAPQGTPGYVDPQYHQNFHLSDKSDVYSFGVVLVEILTAKKVVDFSRHNSEVNLAALAVDRIGNGRLDEILDPYLDTTRDAWTLSSVHKVAELAFRCLAYHSDMRPSMTEVADELECVRVSGWAALYEEENISMGGSSDFCCSPVNNGSMRSLSTSGSMKKGSSMRSLSTSGSMKKGSSKKAVSVPPRIGGGGGGVGSEYLGSLGEVEESSPVSVQDGWFSEHSSPSATSLLSNVVQ